MKQEVLMSNSEIVEKEAKGGIHDFANVIELTILSDLKLLNSKLIEKGISQSDRLVLLNEEANKEKTLFTSY